MYGKKVQITKFHGDEHHTYNNKNYIIDTPQDAPIMQPLINTRQGEQMQNYNPQTWRNSHNFRDSQVIPPRHPSVSQYNQHHSPHHTSFCNASQCGGMRSSMDRYYNSTLVPVLQSDSLRSGLEQGELEQKGPYSNYFKEYTFSDFPKSSDYNRDQFAIWEGLRHRQDTAEYFRSTQNDNFYRCETQDELENRIISPGNPLFLNEITPERVAEDPGDVIMKNLSGWIKNMSDGSTSYVMRRAQKRDERKANHLRMRNQMGLFMSREYRTPDYGY